LTSRFWDRVPHGQFIRYLLVGGWNTLFGLALYSGLTYLLTRHVKYAYMFAFILSNIIGISVAFIGYKLFVFRTKGNWLREYLRCFSVYGTAMGINFLLLPIAKTVFDHILSNKLWAPYAAGALLTGVTVIISFFGHRHFSFKPQKVTADE
jgi:putative flippase GtrA